MMGLGVRRSSRSSIFTITKIAPALEMLVCAGHVVYDRSRRLYAGIFSDTWWAKFSKPSASASKSLENSFQRFLHAFPNSGGLLMHESSWRNEKPVQSTGFFTQIATVRNALMNLVEQRRSDVTVSHMFFDIS